MLYKKEENSPDLESLELEKLRICFGGEDVENIWIRRNKETNQAYLVNHALGFYPFPTWGLSLDLNKKSSGMLDLENIRGKSPEDCTLTLHTTVFDSMLESEHIDEAGNLTDKFFTDNAG